MKHGYLFGLYNNFMSPFFGCKDVKVGRTQQCLGNTLFRFAKKQFQFNGFQLGVIGGNYKVLTVGNYCTYNYLLREHIVLGNHT